MNKDKIKELLLAQGPETNWLARYLTWMDEASDTVDGEIHHILPKCLFPEFANLKSHVWNRKNLLPRDHLIAHYYLYRALPHCTPVVFAFYNMVGISKIFEEPDVNPDFLQQIALAYEEAKIKAKKLLSLLWTPERRQEHSSIVKKYNKKANKTLSDYACDKCGREFNQVTKGVFGGHRKACLSPQPIINSYHRILTKKGFVLTQQLGVYFAYTHPDTSQLIEVTYENTKDKHWSHKGERRTTVESLRRFLNEGEIPPPRKLNLKERAKYKTFKRDEFNRFVKFPVE
jgi:hypothetical protein